MSHLDKLSIGDMCSIFKIESGNKKDYDSPYQVYDYTTAKNEFGKDKLHASFKSIYRAMFEVKLSDSDIKEWLTEKSMFYIVYKGDVAIAYIRYKDFSKKETDFGEYSETMTYGFICDLASIEQGYGFKLMKLILDEYDAKKQDTLLVPWKDDLVEYYQKYSYVVHEPNERGMPKKIMSRRYR